MSILVSDSNELIRENLTEFLSDSGYEVVAVESRQQLLDAQRLQSIKVVLLDCPEDESNVIETIQKIYQLNPSIVVMAMLIEPTLKKVFRLIDNNVFNILIKPLSMNDINVSVEKAIMRYQDNSEIRIFQKNKKLILSSLKKQGVELFQQQNNSETTLLEV